VTSAIQLLADLSAAGIRLYVEEGQLKFKAPKGAMTDAFRQAIGSLKPELIALLSSPGTRIPRAAAKTHIPLSFSQQRLWFLDQLEPNSPFYNIASAQRIEGRLDPALLQQALDTVSTRHDSLRTRFINEDGEPQQLIYSDSRVKIQFYDLSAQNPEQQQENLHIIRNRTIAHGFDLSEDALFRLALVKLQEQTHELILSMHHIISDGWSMALLVNELTHVYIALGAGQTPELPALEIQFSDYAVWQRQTLIGERLESELNFWRTQLRDVPNLELPTDFPRPPVRSSNGQLYRFSIPSELSQQVKQCAQKNNVTLFMLLFASVQLWLHKYSQQTDFCIGTPVAGRNLKELEPLIGFFVNTLPIRCQWEGNPNFVELLKQVQSNCLAAFSHQDVPLEQLVDELGVARDMSHTPLFQVMFALQNQSTDVQQIAGLSFTNVEVQTGTSKFDLTFNIEENGEALNGLLEYSTDLFSQDRIQKQAQQFVTLLRAIVADPQRQLSELCLLSVEEKAQQLNAWNRSDEIIAQHENMVERFEKQAAKSPDAVALRTQHGSMSYGQLNAAANRLAHYLVEKGATGKRVGIALPRGIEMIVALLGTLKAGAAYVPMDTQYPTERLLHIAKDSSSTLIITDTTQVKQLTGVDSAIFCFNRDARLLDAYGNKNPNIEIKPDDLIYVIYTSGSTGLPKGAAVTHAGEVNLQHWYQSLCQLGEQDSCILISAFGFDLTQKNIFITLAQGGKLVLPVLERFDPAQVCQLIEAEQISLLNCAPSMFYSLLEENAEALHSLKFVVLGGEPIATQRIHTWYSQRFPHTKIVNSYGPTECTDVVAYHVVTPDQAEIPLGRPIANTQLYVLSEHLELLPQGSAGELCVAGAGVGPGYLNNAALTAKAFVENPFTPGKLYKTGDLARFKLNGELVYIGRKDFQVKIRGQRIELGEIEYALKQLGGVKDALVVKWNENLLAYVVRDHHFIGDGWRTRLQQTLPEYMVPSYLLELDSWPLSPNGKIDRKALPEPDTQHEAQQFIAPRTPTEIKLSDAWCLVLQRSKISVTADFFHLGGHSLLATKLVSKMRELFKLDIPVRFIFENTSIERQAALLDTQAFPRLSAPIRPLDRAQSLPLSFAQHRLWFLDQLDPGNTAYNMPAALKLTGMLNIRNVEKSFEEIIRRHETLRSNFMSRDGIAELVIHPPEALQIPVEDWSKLPTAEQQQKLKQEIDADANFVFDLARDKLFRCRIIQLGSDEYVLLLNMHHIVSDGWSLGVLVDEFVTLYRAFSQGLPSPLPALKIQYADFAHWQRELLQGEERDRLLSYWLEKLRGAPDVLRLPTDKPRPKTQTFNGAHFPIQLDQQLTSRIYAFCHQHRITPFMLLLGTFQYVVSRWAQQPDVCVGIPIAGRNRSEIEPLIGFFINGLIMRTDCGGNPSVEQFLERVKETALGGFAHQDIPADVLLDALQLERHAETSPGAQVGFALQNAPMGNLDQLAADLKIENLQREHTTAKYECLLLLEETSNLIQGVFEYNTDLFVADSMQRLSDHFIHVLQQFLDTPTAQLDNIELVRDAELYQSLTISPEHSQIRRLSLMQRDIYLDALASTDYRQNCLGYWLHIDRPLNPEHWRKALQFYTNTQSLLRMRIAAGSHPWLDVAYAVIEKHADANLTVMDLTGQRFDSEVLTNLIRQTIYRHYDLSKPPLSTNLLIKVADNDWHFIHGSHHLIVDGVCFGVHAQALCDLYGELTGGNPLQVKPDRFHEYIDTNRRAFDTSDVLEFWKEKFKSVEGLEFSCQHRAETDLQIEKTMDISEQDYKAIKQYCRSKTTTPARFFKAVYAILIQFYCRAEADFYFDEVLSGREREHLNTLGCYFHNVPTVVPLHLLNPAEPIQLLLDYIKHYSKQTDAYASLSNLALRRIAPQSRTRFMYNFYHFLPSIHLEGRLIESRAHIPEMSGPVQLVIAQVGAGLNFNLKYTPGLFEDREFLQRFLWVANQIMAGCETHRQLALLLPEEKQTSLIEWNRSEHELVNYSTVVEWFEARVTAAPDAVAIKQGEYQLSYAQLNANANQLAHHLIQQGVKPNMRIGLCLDRSAQMMTAVLGVLKAGAAYVPMDTQYPEARLQHMLEDAEVPLLITQRCAVARFSDYNGKILVVDAETLPWQQQSTLNPPLRACADDMIYVIYTSGSTGLPKGAAVRHSGEINLLNWYCGDFGISHQDKTLIISAFGFDLTQKNLFAVLMQGGTLVLPDCQEYDPDAILRTIQREQISLINCAPSAFYPLVENPAHYPALRSLKWLFLGGEPIRVEALRPWLKHPGSQCKLINSYGPTECTDVVSFYSVDPNLEELLPIGFPIHNTQLYIVDDALRPLPPGLIGEVCVAGAGVGLGYLKRDELNAEKFVSNPFGAGKLYRTGDLGRHRSDGAIEYLGRKDFQIKIRGLRIELGEIEHALKQVERVRDALVLVKEDRLIAYVLSDTQYAESDWRPVLARHVPDYMIPNQLIAVPVWPLTPNGKIDRKALPEPDAVVQREYVAPRDATEQRLADIWADVIGTAKVGIFDNFFEIGGNSLIAARAVAKLRQEFEIEIPLRALFEMHTIADIAAYINATQWAMQSAAQPVTSDENRDEGFI